MDFDVQQIVQRRPGGEIADALGPSSAVQWLLNRYRGAEDARHRDLSLQMLVEWKSSCEREADHASLFELDRIGKHFEIPALISEQPPLMCGSFGSQRELSSVWKKRLRRLRGAVSGRRDLKLDAVGIDVLEDEPPSIGFGDPDQAAFYGTALRYEQETGHAFPSPLAAFWSIADGIEIDESPFLAPMSEWEHYDSRDFTDTLEVSGTKIGCGQSHQGTLVFGGRDGDPLAGPILDIDDDAIIQASYPSFDELVDALLGTK